MMMMMMMDSRSACIQGVLKVKVKVKGHWILGMSYSVIDGLVAIVGVRRYSLMRRCWDANPTRRPSFSDIKTYLEGHLSLNASNSSPSNNNAKLTRDTSEAAAYRPASDGYEHLQMRDVIPGSNDYRQSIPVFGYLSPSA